MQLSASTFDAHVFEIVGTLLLSATVVLLHPSGNMDFVYFTQALQDKQVTYMLAVPTFINYLYDFIEHMDGYTLSTIRSLCSAG